MIHALTLSCPTCEKETAHRILHIRAYRQGSLISGIAKCSSCRATLPFHVKKKQREVRLILSNGARSKRLSQPINARRKIARGNRLEVEGREAVVTRVEQTEDGNIRTLWAVPTDRVTLKLSLVQGSRTRSLRVSLPPTIRLSIGERVRVGGRPFLLYALRLQNRTLTLQGEGRMVKEIKRAYARGPI